MCDLSRCVGGSQGNEGTVPSLKRYPPAPTIEFRAGPALWPGEWTPNLSYHFVCRRWHVALENPLVVFMFSLLLICFRAFSTD